MNEKKIWNANWIDRIRFLLFSKLLVRRIYKFLFYCLFPAIIFFVMWKKDFIAFDIWDQYISEYLLAIAFFLCWFISFRFIYQNLTVMVFGWEKMFEILTKQTLWIETEKGPTAYPVIALKNLVFYLHKNNNLVEVKGELRTASEHSVLFSTSFPSTTSQWDIWQEQVASQKLLFTNTLFSKVRTKILFPFLGFIVFLAAAGSLADWIYRVKILQQNTEETRINQRRAREERREELEKEAEKKKNYLKPLFPRDIALTFDDIGGYKSAKKGLKITIKAIKNPKKKHVTRGIVLYGPPGTGKTLLAQAFAKEIEMPFYFASGSDLKTNRLGTELGANESKLFALFEQVNDYRKKQKLKKVILFIDEFDNMSGKIFDSLEGIGGNLISGGERGFGSGGTELKELMGGGKYSKRFENIVVIVTTNNIDWFEQGVLRPQRLGKQFNIGFPDSEDLREIIDIWLKKFSKSHPEEKFTPSLKECGEVISKTLSEKKFYFVGADVEEIIKLLPNFKEDEEPIDEKVIKSCIEDFCSEKITNRKKEPNPFGGRNNFLSSGGFVSTSNF